MKNLKVLFTVLCVACATTVWGEEVTLASWTFESGTAGTNYPSNKTNFSASAGTCMGSTFYLNGTGSTWNTTKGWAFTAVTDVQITIKAATAIAKGSKLTFSVTTYYNKASNAPMKGFSLTCKEGSGVFGTTGLSEESWSLSTSSTARTVTYTTQNAIAKDGTICLKLTQTGKAGSGQGYMGPISVTMLGSSGSTETTDYFDVSFVDNVQGTDCSSFDMTHVAENTQIVFNSISDKPQATTGTCEQTHYHFVGWIEDGGEGPNETGSNVIAAGTTTIKVTKDVTYKAVWAQKAN